MTCDMFIKYLLDNSNHYMGQTLEFPTCRVAFLCYFTKGKSSHLDAYHHHHYH